MCVRSIHFIRFHDKQQYPNTKEQEQRGRKRERRGGDRELIWEGRGGEGKEGKWNLKLPGKCRKEFQEGKELQKTW